jgi:hypothetical protein
MSASPSRLELFIDVLDERNQRALVLPTLTVAELVGEILQEFRSLGYLSPVTGDYQLLKASDRSLLNPGDPVGKLVAQRERLLLVEPERPLPEKAQRPTRHLYLRDEDAGNVHKIHWLPAIIGRSDESQQQNKLMVVDLTGHERALRVSRRQAQITEENGQYFIQSMSQNVTTIKDEQGAPVTLGSNKHPLKPGQIIYLENSQITLKFLVREKERSA